ncbi:uncharacterized protein FPRO_08402 [Fusarium proliferatum ET1]|uniref:Uncharacterized protein n=2 Tax=Gibberella intermedia TaxID=948311 RepID=A0A1L7W300_FUSPR|nr:uncharacterized protein FPRO_08402 [Fusarium proliferatum ET1]RBA10004.1 hypothetical protein FPRO05_05940 [Fusarium proliferatum]CZR47028.1 uncharacterized protein FPRO_08402 [Fusarium proliferatum ET1]
MESTQQVEKQSTQETSPSSTRENVADLVFPNLTSLWLSQEPEDQASLKRLKQVWDMFSSGWSPQDKMHIYRLLPEVRTNPTNRKVPSKHKLYKHDITFGLWVILRCIYPDQKLPALRLALMERYPGIDLSAFTGPIPKVSCMTPQERIPRKRELKVVTPCLEKNMLEEDDKINPSGLSLKEEDCAFDDTVILIPKFEPHLDQIRSSKPDKPSAQRLKEVESKMRGMVLGEPHSASYNNFLKSKSSTAPVDVSNYAPDITKLCISPSAMQKADVASLASDDSSPEDDSAQTVLSNKQFLELKNLITNVTTESKRDVFSEMRKMHTETTKQIQNMHTEMIDQFKKNRKTLVDIGKQVAEIRAHIELARMDRKDLDEVEARAINLEQFILSL